MRTLCLGEALVDLVCERPLEDATEADAFVPHFGGAVANQAVHAARLGARVGLLGAAGEDPWGRWLHARLVREGVDADAFALVPGGRTPIAFYTVDADGEPTFDVHGESLGGLYAALAPRVADAVERHDALLVSSNTLVGEPERAVTLDALRLARAGDRPVLVDLNLRLARWPSTASAVEAARVLIPGSFLVKGNLEEGRLLTEEEAPEAVCAALLAAGARHVVLTLGTGGLLLRGGGVDRAVPAVPAHVVDATGAGDAVMGTLVGHLALAGGYAPALAAALPAAAAAGAATCEHPGALR